MTNCPNCGANLKVGVQRCVKCGTTVAAAVTPPPPPASVTTPSPVMTQLPDGTQVATLAYAVKPKSKVAAIVMGVFLGFLGVHNFYLGRTLSGTLQLLLGLGGMCFGGWVLSGLWALAEVIMIASGAIDKDARGMPLV